MAAAQHLPLLRVKGTNSMLHSDAFGWWVTMNPSPNIAV